MGMLAPFHDVPFFLRLQLSTQFKLQPFKKIVFKLQQQDERLADLIAYLKSDQFPPNNNMARLLLLTVNDYFFMIIFFIICGHQRPQEKGSLCAIKVVPNGLQLQITQAALYDVFSGNLGVPKTYKVVRQRFYWLTMLKDIQHYC